MLTTPEETSAHLSGSAMAVRTGLRATGALLWRRRWVVLVMFAVMANVVAAGLVVTGREYTASARVAVTPKSITTAPPVDYTDLLGTIADVAGSRPLLTEVAAKVSGPSVEQLRDEVRGSAVSGTLLVKISVSDSDADRAAQIANDVAEALPAHDPSGGMVDYHVTEQAVAPQGFSSPNVPLVALAGLLLAALLALVAAALADRMFRTVTGPDELGEVSETSVLGVIPRPEDPDGIPALDLDAEEFQALRALRIGVEFASAQDPSRLLVAASVSGSDPWPGWMEINLATALAEVGHRVLVINADREGEVHPALDAGVVGLYDVLSGSHSLVEAVAPGPTARVDVLPVGQAHLAGPSLLEMRFRGLLQDTEDDYDVVIVHAAPVSGSEDARIMAIHGAMLLTVPAGRVHPRFVSRVVEHMRGIRLRVLGSVLVGVRPARRRRRVRAA